MHLLPTHLHEWVPGAFDFDHLGPVFAHVVLDVSEGLKFVFVFFDGQLGHPLAAELVGVADVLGGLSGVADFLPDLQLAEGLGLLDYVEEAEQVGDHNCCDQHAKHNGWFQKPLT